MARKKKEHLDLSNVEEFVGGFIGLIIVKFKVYDDKQNDYNNLLCKIVTGVSAFEGKITLSLSTLSGGDAGSITITPTETGEFIEKNDYEEETWQAKYRISFYGGNCIEYVDLSKKCKISMS
jgi:hypothetical protein